MTEPERLDWDAITTSADLTTVIAFLRETASDRKLRLQAAACGRRVWHMLTDEASRLSVELAERLADGLVTEEERKAVSKDAMSVASLAEYDNFDDDASTRYIYALCIASYATYPSAFQAARNATNAILHTGTTNQDAEKDWVIGVLRDVFGGQFHSVSSNPAWLTRTVLALAQTTYDNRILPSGTLDHDRLSILADALEDAGCTEAVILEHLRTPGPHVRGCAVLDLILGKE